MIEQPSIYRFANALYVGHAHNESGEAGPLELGMELATPFGRYTLIYQLEPDQVEEVISQIKMADAIRLTCNGPDNHGSN